jgi:hypothetical protein
MFSCLQNSAMKPPKLEQFDTKHGKIWRITCAGMIKEHHQEWQARCFYHQAVLMYAGRLADQD